MDKNFPGDDAIMRALNLGTFTERQLKDDEHVLVSWGTLKRAFARFGQPAQPAQHDIDTGEADDSVDGGAQASPESPGSSMVIDDGSGGEVDDPVAQLPGYGYHDGENPPNGYLYQMMAPYHLNLCRGHELRSVIDFGRDVWRRALTVEQPRREDALRRAIGLLGMAVARLGPEDHEIRDRIRDFINPPADSDQQQGEQNA